MSSARPGRLQQVAVYVGGLMGPFSGLIPGVILSEIGASFDISAVEAALCLPAFLIPFSSLLLISGSLSQTLGPSRMLRVAYAGCILSALICALAPTWGVFLIGCVFAGTANAFTTPNLLSTIARTLPKERLGRGLGLFTAMQALGQLSAPGFGGLMATVDWRLAYATVALFAFPLLIVGVPAIARSGRFQWRRLLDGLSWPVARIGAAQFALGTGVAGIAFLVAIQASAAFDSGPAERGLIIMSGGAVAFFVAPFAGRAVDRWGAERVLVFALLSAAVAIFVVPVVATPWLLAVAWATAWTLAQVGAVAANGAALTLPNGSAGISVTHSFRYFGSASSPLLLLPIFEFDGPLGFWVAAGLLAAAAGVLRSTGGRLRRSR